MRHRLLGTVIGILLALGAFIAPSAHHVVKADNSQQPCCTQLVVYADPQQGKTIQWLCINGDNQNWVNTWDCANAYNPPPNCYLGPNGACQFANYWWQVGPNTVGQGYVIIYMYYTDGTYYGIQVALPYVSSCHSYYDGYESVDSLQGTVTC